MSDDFVFALTLVASDSSTTRCETLRTTSSLYQFTSPHEERAVRRLGALAREWYKKAVVWMDKNRPDDEELKRIRAETEKVLGIDGH